MTLLLSGMELGSSVRDRHGTSTACRGVNKPKAAPRAWRDGDGAPRWELYVDVTSRGDVNIAGAAGSF